MLQLSEFSVIQYTYIDVLLSLHLLVYLASLFVSVYACDLEHSPIGY